MDSYLPVFGAGVIIGILICKAIVFFNLGTL